MENIPILAIPNQSFTTTINDVRYDFVLRSNDVFMTYDLSADEVVLLQGFRLVIGQLMIPYKYLEIDGNFFLYTPEDEDPNYLNFGGTQNLYYLTADETEVFRDGA